MFQAQVSQVEIETVYTSLLFLSRILFFNHLNLLNMQLNSLLRRHTWCIRMQILSSILSNYYDCTYRQRASLIFINIIWMRIFEHSLGFFGINVYRLVQLNALICKAMVEWDCVIR